MIETLNGCTRTEIWVVPEDWATTKAKSALKKSWHVQCNFHDPAFKDKYPKGFPFRVKVNKGNHTLQARQAAVRYAIEEMENLLDEQGYNPIPGAQMFLAPKTAEPEDIVYNTETPLHLALDLACSLTEVGEVTKKDIEKVVEHFKVALKVLGHYDMPVNSFLNMYAVATLQNVRTKKTLKALPEPLTDKRYNRYAVYLSGLFKILRKNKMVDSNPFEDFKMKQVEVEARQILTKEEEIRVDLHLRKNYPAFWLYTQIFYHSSGREEELMRLQCKDVCLDPNDLKYTVLVKKGGKPKRIERPIKKISVQYWEKVLLTGRPNDYVFSVGLVPGASPIRREQITRRWRTHVKEKLGITADFYSLKHSNLTEISKKSSAEDAARAAGHRNTNMVRKHYDVELKTREMNNVRKMRNHFGQAPQNIDPGFYCAPPAFTLHRPNSQVDIAANVPDRKIGKRWFEKNYGNNITKGRPEATTK